jgi:hypothetical protein
VETIANVVMTKAAAIAQNANAVANVAIVQKKKVKAAPANSREEQLLNSYALWLLENRLPGAFVF